MRVTALALVDFRNHDNLSLAFSPGVSTILGRNGRGKTNIIEAINYVATLGSHRVSTDSPLIRRGCNSAHIGASIVKQDRSAAVEIDIVEGRSNTVTLNGSALRKPRDVLGLLQCVVFAPEDLDLVKGDPTARRRYLDDFATAMAPRIAGVRADYEKVLRSRNALLKSAGRRPLGATAQASLEAWNDQFVLHASSLVHARLRMLAQLQPHIESHGAMISGGTEPLTASYVSSWLEESAREVEDIRQSLWHAIRERHRDEVERGVSLVGPHRDDVLLSLSGGPAKGYASHGQSWSIALALRLATFSVLREVDDDPVLILDDVFAELDARRRERLLSALAGAEQTLVTAAVAQDVPQALMDNTIELGE